MIAYPPTDGTTAGINYNSAGNGGYTIYYNGSTADDDTFEKRTYRYFSEESPGRHIYLLRIVLLISFLLCKLVNKHSGGYQKNSKNGIWTGRNFRKIKA